MTTTADGAADGSPGRAAPQARDSPGVSAALSPAREAQMAWLRDAELTNAATPAADEPAAAEPGPVHAWARGGNPHLKSALEDESTLAAMWRIMTTQLFCVRTARK